MDVPSIAAPRKRKKRRRRSSDSTDLELCGLGMAEISCECCALKADRGTEQQMKKQRGEEGGGPGPCSGGRWRLLCSNTETLDASRMSSTRFNMREKWRMGKGLPHLSG